MTFYEAALRVLESAGRPLHFLEITEQSIQQSLLSHVGKTPEQTMLSRLAAMARRPRERKVVVTAKDTFALADWALPEDPEALAQTGLVEPNPEESMPLLRTLERHPEPRNENVRAVGRGDRKRRRDEDDEGRGRKKRFPPIPEVVFELLSETGTPLKPVELAELARSRDLGSDELSAEKILTALLEDNQRRIDAGRRPQYMFDPASGQISLERAGSRSDAPPLELQAAFAAALGIKLEAGRPALAKLPVEGGEAGDALVAFQTARTAVKDARRAMARTLRRRLDELDPGAFERAIVRMLQGLGFRELKVAKRSKEGPLLTTRKREGSVELRYAIRILKGAGAVDRKAVQELRRDLGHYSAQVGLLVSAADVRGDARGEAQATGSLVMLWCGEALAEKFFDAKVAVSPLHLELYELDERFFVQAKLEAEEAKARREERVRERGPRQARQDVEPATEEVLRPVMATRSPPSAVPGEEPERSGSMSMPRVAAASPDSADEGEDEGEDEGDDDNEAASELTGVKNADGTVDPAAPGSADRKRRRRRRRGRRGRGVKPGEGAEGGVPAAGLGANAGALEAAPAPAAGDRVASGGPENSERGGRGAPAGGRNSSRDGRSGSNSRAGVASAATGAVDSGPSGLAPSGTEIVGSSAAGAVGSSPAASSASAVPVAPASPEPEPPVDGGDNQGR